MHVGIANFVDLVMSLVAPREPLMCTASLSAGSEHTDCLPTPMSGMQLQKKYIA
jgi:hypothetical protein